MLTLDNFKKIEPYSELVSTINSAINSMRIDDIGGILQKQLKAGVLLNELYIKMGKHVIDLDE